MGADDVHDGRMTWARTRAPLMTDDPLCARALVAEFGCAILTDQGVTSADSVATAHRVFGADVLEVPEPAEVRIGGDRDRKPADLDHTTPLPPHTDGFSYGQHYPDHFLLLCGQASPVGGESYLVDGYAVLDQLAADGQRDLLAWLATTSIDQTEPDMQRSISPILGTAPSGRRMLRLFPFQQPSAESRDPLTDASMIARWRAAVHDAAAVSQRFKLEPGEAVIIDNFRMMHGREAYTDLDRLMWRVWVWTRTGNGVPDVPLHSDSRYAVADAAI